MWTLGLTWCDQLSSLAKPCSATREAPGTLAAHRPWHCGACAPHPQALSALRKAPPLLPGQAALPNTDLQPTVIKHTGQPAWVTFSEVFTTNSLNSTKVVSVPCHATQNPSQSGVRECETSQKQVIYLRKSSYLCGLPASRLGEGSEKSV